MTLKFLTVCVYLSTVFLLVSFVNGDGGTQRETCGGTLTEPRGIIQTPNFPGPFNVPIKCKWVIDTSSQPENTFIVIYLTQLFVTIGLKFTEYPYYDPESSFPSIGGRLLHSVTEKNVTTVAWIETNRQFVVIDFELDRLEGNHIRAMDGLLDVYGFNITYEARHDVDANQAVRYQTCNVVACSLLGHCYANENFTEYWCSCFPGFYGPDCGQGPLCMPERITCENNATCRHAGATAVVCSCLPGYTGTRCELLQPSPAEKEIHCNGTNCILQCPYTDYQEPCSCPSSALREAPTDRARYQGTVRLAPLPDGTTVKEFLKFQSQSNKTLQHQLEKLISKFLQKYLMKIEELRIINITSEGDVTFHFFGGKTDGKKVREALNKLVENGRIGNISLVSTQLSFRQEPTLLLQEVIVNHKRPIIRHGDEFILSCVAQGSSYMTFRWLKDGVIVNGTKSLRNIWTRLLPLDSRDRYTALLGIRHADILDEGTYTCQVTDWGFEQCKSINLEVIPPPPVKVTPMSITVEKGQNLTILCSWRPRLSDVFNDEQVYGYSWFKESKDSKDAYLFKMERNKEVWEDLHPSGSILKIYNIQKSTKYTCQVQSTVSPANASVDVEVLNKSAIPWCPADESGVGGVHWNEVGAWGLAKVECPAQYNGIATRLCSLVNPGQAQWQTPDFSDCISDRLSELGKSFRSLTLGYQNTSGADTILGILGLLRDRTVLYPGEGEPALSLLQNISWYLNYTSAWEDLVHATPFFFSTINALLQHHNALINEQKVVDLQHLVNKWALLWGSHIGSADNGHLSFDSLVVDVFSFDSSIAQGSFTVDVPRPTYSYPGWFKASVSVLMESDGLASLRNGTTYCVAVIIYKNLVQYLPVRHIYKKDDGNEVQYEVASSIVSVVASTPLQVITDVTLPTKARTGWNVTCGMMKQPWTKWKLDQCLVTILKVNEHNNMTQCSCRSLGSFTTLITKQVPQYEAMALVRGDSVVLLGCLSCLIQCLLTLALLLIRWYNHPTCVVFLKLQCCVAISATMAVFFSATRANLHQSAYPYVVTSLEAFLLIGMSSHLSKLLLVYTEVVHLPKINNIKQTVICIITGFPLLVVLCNHLAHNATGWNLTSWWLVKGTMLFYSCIVCGVLLTVLFIFLYCSVMRRLALLSKIKTTPTDSNKAIERRVGLLKRAAIIFVTMLIMAIASIFYINCPGNKSQYAFSFTCALLGFVLLACYVVHSESSLHMQILQKLNVDVGTVYSSGSDSNPLSFYTKQDGERESESAPPTRRDGTKETTLGSGESIPLRDVASPSSLPSVITPQSSQTHSDVVQQSKSGKMVVTGEGSEQEEEEEEEEEQELVDQM